MAKTGASFKLSKSTKRALCTIVDPVKRGQWKRAMIDAEYSASIVPKSTKKDRSNFTTTSNSATSE